MSSGIPTPTLLTYSDIVDVTMTDANDINFADVEDYGHRVSITVDKTKMNEIFQWTRAVGAARPSAVIGLTSGFRSALITALGTTHTDIDGVTGGLHFGSDNLSLNTDSRLRKNSQISANDIPMAFVLYKLYGNSSVTTLGNIFNLQDAHDMVSNETVVDAIITSLETNESGAVNTMFRDLLAADPRRFFNTDGIPETGIFETSTDVTGSGSWNITDNDIIEIKTKLIFNSKVTRRGVSGNQTGLPSNNQLTVISPGDYFYIRLQLKAADVGSVTPPAPVAPAAPTSLNAIEGDGTVIIDFIAGSDNGSTITKYQYSLNGGAYVDAIETSSPITIPDLTNGTTYSITLRAYNAGGPGTASSAVTATPVAPSIGSRGIPAWATSLYFIGNSLTDVKASITDSEGNVYITGQYTSPNVAITVNNMNGNTQSESSIQLPASSVAGSLFLIKYNSSGQAQWATHLVTAATSPSIGWGLAKDSSNNIYLAGQYQSSTETAIVNAVTTGSTYTSSGISLPISASNSLAFFIKYNSSGVAQMASYFNGSGSDVAYSIAVDSTNSIYLTGQLFSSAVTPLYNAITTGATYVESGISLPSTSSNAAIFLIKYNASGSVAWSTYFNGSGSDIGYSIKIDQYDYIYLTGQYNSNTIGNLYNAITSGSTYSSTSMALPSNGATANAGICIVKYNSNGVVQRSNLINGTSVDVGNALAIDSSNYIYLTGYYNSSVTIYNPITSGFSYTGSTITLPISTGGSALLLVKYNSDLEPQWATYLDDITAGTPSDVGSSIIIDSYNNVYVAGFSTLSSQLTLQNVSGSGQTPSSITLPASTIDGQASQAAILLKYDSNGQAQWANYINGTHSDWGRSLCIDSNDNVYMSGSYTSFSNVTLNDVNNNAQSASSITLPAGRHAFLIKYNFNGITQGAVNLVGVGNTVTTNQSIGRTVAVDSNNNVYIAGSYAGTSIHYVYNANNTLSSIYLPATTTAPTVNTYLIKYDSNGNALWATYGITGSTGIVATIQSATVDSNNNLYVVGGYNRSTGVVLYNGLSSGGTYVDSGIALPSVSTFAVFIVKYNASGVVQWANHFNATGSDTGYSIKTDSSNYIYIAGAYNGSSTVQLNNAITSGSTYTLSSVFLQSTTGNDIFLIKYSSIGEVVWANCIKGSLSDIAQSLTIDSSNSVYLIGGYNSTSTIDIPNAITTGSTYTGSGLILPVTANEAMYLIKFNSDGGVQWATYLNGDSADRGYSVTLDSANNIYVTGTYTSSVIVPIYNAITTGSTYPESGISLSATSAAAMFIIKYNPNGSAIWATFVDGASAEQANAITVDSLDNIYIGGGFSSGISLYDAITSGSTFTASSVSLPSLINNSAALIKYDSSGIVQWATKLGGTGLEYVNGLSCDSNDKLYAVGSYISSKDFYVYDASTQSESSVKIMGSYVGAGSFLVKYT
jgi:hypothetical protein